MTEEQTVEDHNLSSDEGEEEWNHDDDVSLESLTDDDEDAPLSSAEVDRVLSKDKEQKSSNIDWRELPKSLLKTKRRASRLFIKYKRATEMKQKQEIKELYKVERKKYTEGVVEFVNSKGKDVGNKGEESQKVVNRVRVAISGCSHGEMDTIYDTMAEIEKTKGFKFDLLICCGDYQSVRNYGDLYHMHVKEKFRDLQTFYKYYSGAKKAPVLTLFVGGNHEASGFLSELPNGGWVAPNIYYMGFANVVEFAGLRIAGLSGIFSAKDYNKGHFERPPFSHGSEVSAYHVRAVDMFRLKQLRPRDGEVLEKPIDIMITHDWPAGITDYGDVGSLLRFKPYFKEDIDMGRLGNPATMQLLQELSPRYWFSAHLHCGFPALVPHKDKGGKKIEPTRFLALDKPIVRRHFLQMHEIEGSSDGVQLQYQFNYDATWLAILKNTDKFTEVSNRQTFLPTVHNEKQERWDFRPTDEELKEITSIGSLNIPSNFAQTAPPLAESSVGKDDGIPEMYYRNPQSAHFCKWLGIGDLNQMLCEEGECGTPYYLTKLTGRGEIEIDEEEDEEKFGDSDFILDVPSDISPIGKKIVPVAPNQDPADLFTADEWKPPSANLLADFEAPSIDMSRLPSKSALPMFKAPAVTENEED